MTTKDREQITDCVCFGTEILDDINPFWSSGIAVPRDGCGGTYRSPMIQIISIYGRELAEMGFQSARSFVGMGLAVEAKTHKGLMDMGNASMDEWVRIIRERTNSN